MTDIFQSILSWLSNYSGALFGFFGVIVGSGITYFTETHFRKKDRQERNRVNYILSLNQLSKVYSEQVTLLEVISKNLPETQPELIVNHVSPMVSAAFDSIDLDNERLIPLAVKGHTFFERTQLCFSRYEAVIELFQNYETMRVALNEYMKIESLNTGRNFAIVQFDLSSPEAIQKLVMSENLTRHLFVHLSENIQECNDLIRELNLTFSKRYDVEYTFKKIPKFQNYTKNLPQINVRDLPPFHEK